MDNRFCKGDERNCPYYRPRSNSCLWSLCPLMSKKEKTMDQEFHYAAIDNQQISSGQFQDVEQAVKWAKEQLSNKPSLTKIYIYQVLKVVEKQFPPFEVREIKGDKIPDTCV